MASPALGVPRSVPSDDENAEDVLERMLKEAEELAMKMSQRTSRSISSSLPSSPAAAGRSRNTRSDTASVADAASPPAASPPAVPAAVSIQSWSKADEKKENDECHYPDNNKSNNNNNNDVDIVDDKVEHENDHDLEELLKKSETLLGKMRSRVSSSGSGSAGPKNDEQSASSPPLEKEQWRRDKNASPFVNAPVVVEPPKSSPKAPTSVYLVENSMASDDVSSIGSLTAPNLRVPVNPRKKSDPIQEEPLMPASKPFQWQPSNTAVSSNNGNSEAMVAATVIPDFTATSPDAKWEKVSSANEGDDDYVPLVDYSKQQRMAATTTTTTPASFTASRAAKFDENRDEYGTGSSSNAALTPRVAAFRAQKRKMRRQRRRRLQMIFLTFVVAAAGAYFWYGRQLNTTPTSTGNSEDPGVVSDDSDEECVADGANLAEELLFYPSMMENVLEMIPEAEALAKFKKGEESTENDKVDEKVEGESKVIKEDIQIPSLEETPKETKPAKGGSTTKNQEVDLGHSASQTEKKCKNVFQRLFNKKCRQLARQKKKNAPGTVKLHAASMI